MAPHRTCRYGIGLSGDDISLRETHRPSLLAGIVDAVAPGRTGRTALTHASHSTRVGSSHASAQPDDPLQTVQVQVLSEHESRPESISRYQSHGASAVRLANGHGEAHAYLLHFETGGAIGRHEAGFGQLFVVLAGRGWVSGDDGLRVEINAGDIVMFDRGEQHAKGSDTGMSVVMVQIRDLDAATG